ncbi:MAG: sigma 54-interacting transcriptional regulator, partial [Deltaproteobacteria bacterium]|nr:sigma 54-interacting transcriptional regulator [Deltaproteobacteria bacterium]
MDENAFFRDATIRICGSLDIQTAIKRCLTLLKEYMPAFGIHVGRFLPERGALRVYASHRLDGGDDLKGILPMPPKARLEFGKEKDIRVQIINDLQKGAIYKSLAQALGKSDISIMEIYGRRYRGKPKRLGSLMIYADGRDQYTPEHARLFSLLNEPIAIAVSNALSYREVLRLQNLLADDNQYLNQELLRLSGDKIIGSALGLREIMGMVRRVAQLDSPVLLLGETGVGKEVIANAIHSGSLRKNKPFIKVNCGAIPESLVDSELFGHEKGAFTGAVSQKRGRFERAHQGSILMDEIGELPPQIQTRLLRVLQHREIERVGGTKTISVDIRVIIATHRNLENMVQSGKFREDLFYRLNVFPIVIPPLRDRKEDIPALVYYFMERKSKEMGFRLPPELASGSMEWLMNHEWPGNVRELKNTVERALIQCRNGILAFDESSVLLQGDRLSFDGDQQEKILRLDEVN